MFKKAKRSTIAIIISLVILFSYSPRILAQIESIYNSNTDQFAGISNLMSAVANNDIQGARFFSKGGSLVVNQKNKGGATALHIACREGNFEIVKILIESGANPNIQDNEGWTPLMRASNVGNSQIVEHLLNNGAKASYFNSQNETALIHSTISRCTECINHLIEKGNLAKDLDTLMLKSQIADAFLIARNQEHKNNQGILESFLDYISKISPLVSKPNLVQNKFDNLSPPNNEKSFVFKNPENFNNKFNDDSYGYMPDPHKPIIAPPVNWNAKNNNQKNIQPQDPQISESKEFDLDIDPNYSYNPPAKKIAEKQPNQTYIPTEIQARQYKFKPLIAQSDIDSNASNDLKNIQDLSSIDSPKTINNQVLSQPENIKKFKFTPIKNNTNLANKFEQKNQASINSNPEFVEIDTAIVDPYYKRNDKNISVDEKQNNNSPLVNNPVSPNSNQVPKLFKFKPTTPPIVNPKIEDSNLVNKPQDNPIENSNNSVKKFKFFQGKSNKENKQIKPNNADENNDSKDIKNVENSLKDSQQNQNLSGKIFKFFKAKKSLPTETNSEDLSKINQPTIDQSKVEKFISNENLNSQAPIEISTPINDDSSTIELLGKRNNKNISVDEKQNNKSPLVNNPVLPNSNQVPKIFKFKPTNNQLYNNLKSPDKNLGKNPEINQEKPQEQPQNVALPTANESMKKFKFTPIKPSKENNNKETNNKETNNDSTNSQNKTNNSDNLNDKININETPNNFDDQEIENDEQNEYLGDKILKFFKGKKSPLKEEKIPDLNQNTEQNISSNENLNSQAPIEISKPINNDSSTIELLSKRNDKNISVDEKQNNNSPLVNNPVSPNSNQVPKLFKFKPTTPPIVNPKIEDSNLVNKPQDNPIENSNNSVKKFKFFQGKSNKENKQIKPNNADENQLPLINDSASSNSNQTPKSFKFKPTNLPNNNQSNSDLKSPDKPQEKPQEQPQNIVLPNANESMKKFKFTPIKLSKENNNASSNSQNKTNNSDNLNDEININEIPNSFDDKEIKNDESSSDTKQSQNLGGKIFKFFKAKKSPPIENKTDESNDNKEASFENFEYQAPQDEKINSSAKKFKFIDKSNNKIEASPPKIIEPETISF